MKNLKPFKITDDVTEGVTRLTVSRLPWLIVGLFGGILASLLVSRFETALSSHLSLVFFIPVIVYLSDAVAEQTETIYVRNLSSFKDNFYRYLAKEVFVGGCLGIVLSVFIGLVAYLWLGSLETAFTVSIAMFINTLIAPVIALIIPEILFKEHVDPALGGGPFTTVIQGFVSLLVYFLVASAIIF